MKPFVLFLLTLALASAAAAQSDGIHVVGDWTLDVREADGTLVESRAFHNALTSTGARYLIDVLTREVAHGAIEVHISGVDGPCDQGDGERFRCVVKEPGALGGSDAVTENLQFEVVPAAAGQPRLIRYTGSFVAAFDDALNRVTSWYARCDYGAELACDASNAGTSSTFTERTLDTPLTVEAGQTVDVTFELSFE